MCGDPVVQPVLQQILCSAWQFASHIGGHGQVGALLGSEPAEHVAEVGCRSAPVSGRVLPGPVRGRPVEASHRPGWYLRYGDLVRLGLAVPIPHVASGAVPAVVPIARPIAPIRVLWLTCRTNQRDFQEAPSGLEVIALQLDAGELVSLPRHRSEGNIGHEADQVLAAIVVRTTVLLGHEDCGDSSEDL